MLLLLGKVQSRWHVVADCEDDGVRVERRAACERSTEGAGLAQRYSLLLMLECNLAEHGLGSQIPARVQTRHHCEWVVSISTAAACPVNVGALCAPNCPRNWLGDGDCLLVLLLDPLPLVGLHQERDLP